jgi:putative effector of murein hydrolase LrgA (UPF0299 family)
VLPARVGVMTVLLLFKKKVVEITVTTTTNTATVIAKITQQLFFDRVALFLKKQFFAKYQKI